MKAKPSFQIKKAPLQFGAGMEKYRPALAAARKHLEAIALELKSLLNTPGTTNSQIYFMSINFVEAEEACQYIAGLCYDGKAHEHWKRRAKKTLVNRFLSGATTPIPVSKAKCLGRETVTRFALGPEKYQDL